MQMKHVTIQPSQKILIMKIIKESNIKSILEIGSAIGYSAILMASSKDDVYVTTIERDEVRYLEALKNCEERFNKEFWWKCKKIIKLKKKISKKGWQWYL